MLTKKLILPSLATLLLFGSAIHAEESTETSTELSLEEHVPVRSREQDPSERAFMHNQRAEQAKEEATDRTDAQAALQRASRKLASSSQSQFMFAPRRIAPLELKRASYAAPVNYHWLANIVDGGHCIQLEDESRWEISPMDIYVLHDRRWGRGDTLVVTPNHSWLSSYDYYITNKTKSDSYVKVNLRGGPLNHGSYSHWIIEINRNTGHVFLENQMIWCVNPQDRYVLKNWDVNDHVIFGLNDSYFCPFDHVLINVNMDNYIRVKQY